MIDYQSIISTLFDDESGEYILDGRAFSFPVATRDSSGAVVDNFFVYGADPLSGASSSPMAYIGIYSETNRIAYYRQAENVIFPVEIAPDVLSYEEYSHLVQKYQELYPVVRSFASSLFLMTEQKQILLDYFDTQRLLFGGRIRYYRSIAPSFYHWMIKMLASDISFLSRCEEGEVNLDELPQYLDMAGDNTRDQMTILGMTQVEFNAWKNQGNNIFRRIIHSRLMGEDFTTYQALSDEQLLAARSYDPSAIDRIKHEDN